MDLHALSRPKESVLVDIYSMLESVPKMLRVPVHMVTISLEHLVFHKLACLVQMEESGMDRTVSLPRKEPVHQGTTLTDLNASEALQQPAQVDMSCKELTAYRASLLLVLLGSYSMETNVCNKASKCVLKDTDITDWRVSKLVSQFVPVDTSFEEIIASLRMLHVELGNTSMD